MFFITRNEGQGRGQQNNHGHHDMDPGSMGVGTDGGKNHGHESYQDTMKYTGGRKDNSQTVPNFFHPAGIPEL